MLMHYLKAKKYYTIFVRHFSYNLKPKILKTLVTMHKNVVRICHAEEKVQSISASEILRGLIL